MSDNNKYNCAHCKFTTDKRSEFIQHMGLTEKSPYIKGKKGILGFFVPEMKQIQQAKKENDIGKAESKVPEKEIEDKKKKKFTLFIQV